MSAWREPCYIGSVDEYLLLDQPGSFSAYVASIPLRAEVLAGRKPKSAHRSEKRSQQRCKESSPGDAAPSGASADVPSGLSGSFVIQDPKVQPSCTGTVSNAVPNGCRPHSSKGTGANVVREAATGHLLAQGQAKPPSINMVGFDPQVRRDSDTASSQLGSPAGQLGRSKSLDFLQKLGPIESLPAKAIKRGKDMLLAAHRLDPKALTANFDITALLSMPASQTGGNGSNNQVLRRDCSAPTVMTQTVLSWLTFSRQMAVNHLNKNCYPCAYFHSKKDGCRRGEQCNYCHLCPPDEIKKRKKEKIRRLKAETEIVPTTKAEQHISVSDCSTSCSSAM